MKQFALALVLVATFAFTAPTAFAYNSSKPDGVSLGSTSALRIMHEIGIKSDGSFEAQDAAQWIFNNMPEVKAFVLKVWTSKVFGS